MSALDAYPKLTIALVWAAIIVIRYSLSLQLLYPRKAWASLLDAGLFVFSSLFIIHQVG
jgi:hypothetical protein